MPPISVLIKPASSMCNMRCKYCFYADVTDFREIRNFGVMSRETAENLIEKAFAFADKGEPVSFAFQGGEPLLAGLEYFKNFTDFVKEKNTKGNPVYYGIQTNGTLVTEEWAEFFKANKFLVGLSLDGDEAGNKFRVSAEKNSTFYTVLQTAQMFKNHGVDFNILTVLTGYCAENGERIYRFFRNKGFRYIQFIPCLRPFGDKSESELYMTEKQYGDFLIRVFNLYVKDYVRNNYISIRQFDNWVQMYLGNRPEQCGMMGHCTFQFVAEGNGNIYPCDFYCTDEWLLGNINEMNFTDFVNGEKMRSFISESIEVPEKCKKCRFYPLCRGGGCKRSRLDRDYCESYKRFFSACLPLFRVFINEPRR